jgi:hypothetical protein
MSRGGSAVIDAALKYAVLTNTFRSGCQEQLEQEYEDEDVLIKGISEILVQLSDICEMGTRKHSWFLRPKTLRNDYFNDYFAITVEVVVVAPGRRAGQHEVMLHSASHALA